MTYSASTANSAATQALAARLAPVLNGGETIELTSDLGGGKTTFVQGLVAAMGYADRVSSPTFTLSNEYVTSDGHLIHHYDLYRLAESGIVGEELAEDMADPKVLTLIEWAGVADTKLPADRLVIKIMVTGDDERSFEFVGGGPNSDAVIRGLSA